MNAYEKALKVFRHTEAKRKRKKLTGLDKYVIFALFVTILYTIAEFVTATITGIEKSTLTTAVYGFWAGEIVTCGLIKIFKLRKENTDEDRLD
jgi:hypothetical protein